MSIELGLSAASLAVTLLLGLLVYVNSRRAQNTAEKKLTAEEKQAERDHEDVITRRRGEELGRLYERLDAMESDMGEQAKEISALRTRGRESDRREKLLYRHVKDLRNHIVEGKPPPPPAMPRELVAWFEDFGITEPSLPRR